MIILLFLAPKARFMTQEVLNLIYLIHNYALLKEEGWNKIAFTTVHCTRFTYVDDCLKKNPP